MKESEKRLERKLHNEVKKLGGWSIKMLSTHITGLPDRMCLFPDGRIMFCEIKTTGEKPTKIQRAVHRKLRRLGFKVLVIDRTAQIKKTLAPYA